MQFYGVGNWRHSVDASLEAAARNMDAATRPHRQFRELPQGQKNAPSVHSVGAAPEVVQMIRNLAQEMELQRSRSSQAMAQLTEEVRTEMKDLRSDVQLLKCENAALRVALRDAHLRPSAPSHGGISKEGHASGIECSQEVLQRDFSGVHRTLAERVNDVESQLTELTLKTSERARRADSLVNEVVNAAICVEVERMRGVAREAARTYTAEALKAHSDSISSAFSAQLEEAQRLARFAVNATEDCDKRVLQLSEELRSQLNQTNEEYRTVADSLKPGPLIQSLRDEFSSIISNSRQLDKQRCDAQISQLRAELSSGLRKMSSEAVSTQQSLHQYVTQRFETIALQAVSRDDVNRIVSQAVCTLETAVNANEKSISVSRQLIDGTRSDVNRRQGEMEAQLRVHADTVANLCEKELRNAETVQRMHNEVEEIRLRVRQAVSDAAASVSTSSEIESLRDELRMHLAECLSQSSLESTASRLSALHKQVQSMDASLHHIRTANERHFEDVSQLRAIADAVPQLKHAVEEIRMQTHPRASDKSKSDFAALAMEIETMKDSFASKLEAVQQRLEQSYKSMQIQIEQDAANARGEASTAASENSKAFMSQVRSIEERLKAQIAAQNAEFEMHREHISEIEQSFRSKSNDATKRLQEQRFELREANQQLSNVAVTVEELQSAQASFQRKQLEQLEKNISGVADLVHSKVAPLESRVSSLENGQQREQLSAAPPVEGAIAMAAGQINDIVVNTGSQWFAPIDHAHNDVIALQHAVAKLQLKQKELESSLQAAAQTTADGIAKLLASSNLSGRALEISEEQAPPVQRIFEDQQFRIDALQGRVEDLHNRTEELQAYVVKDLRLDEIGGRMQEVSAAIEDAVTVSAAMFAHFGDAFDHEDTGDGAAMPPIAPNSLRDVLKSILVALEKDKERLTQCEAACGSLQVIVGVLKQHEKRGIAMAQTLQLFTQWFQMIAEEAGLNPSHFALAQEELAVDDDDQLDESSME